LVISQQGPAHLSARDVRADRTRNRYVSAWASLLEDHRAACADYRADTRPRAGVDGI
jgi:hypothetical protein